MASAEGGAKRTSRLVTALLLSPFVILIASATRLLLIGNYDTTTAMTVASASGVVGTLLGTVVPLLPPFLPIICIIVAFARKWLTLGLTVLATALVSTTYASLPEGWRNAWDAYYHGFLVRVIALDFRSMWQYWAFATICAGVAALVTFLDPPDILDIYTDNPLINVLLLIPRLFFCVAVGAICALVALFAQSVYGVPRDIAAALSQSKYSGDLSGTVVSALVRRPWLPAEEITLKEGEIVGYTLSNENKWFVVLKEHDRTIEYIFADDVVGRRVCSLENDSIDPREPAPLIRLQDINITQPWVCPDMT